MLVAIAFGGKVIQQKIAAGLAATGTVSQAPPFQ